MASLSKTNHSILTTIGFLLLATSMGCGIGASRVKAPSWDPGTITSKAFELADSDGDGQLDEKELEKVPGLKAALSKIDANSDKKISKSELEERVRLYKDGRVAATAVKLQVLYKKRLLTSGKVKLVPEEFLGGLCEAAEGEIFEDGVASPRIPNSDLPGVRLGFYRVEVTSDQKKIPEKYNTNTTLGLEVSPVSDDAASYGAAQKLFLK